MRPTMMRNGTKASKAMESFTPQSATASDTQSGTIGPEFRNGTASCAQITSSAAPALKPLNTAAKAMLKKIAVSTVEPTKVLPSGAFHQDPSRSRLKTAMSRSCATRNAVA